MIKGAQAYYQKTLVQPDSVTQATNQFFDDKDDLKAFIDMELIREAGERTKTDDIYQHYVFCSQAGGVAPLEKTVFVKILKSRFHIDPGRSNGVRVLKGVRIRTSDEPTHSNFMSNGGVYDLAALKQKSRF